MLASVSRGIGVREERRIVGEHVLTQAEARRAVIFSDAVAVNTYHIDFHWPDRMQRAGTGITDMLDPHHLPLRMMIPKGAKNLLVPGRGASADQTAMSAFRVMAVVAQLGFAAGHAARQCIEAGTDVSAIDVPRLQSAIEADGQSLDLSHYGEYLRCDLFVHEPVGAAGVERGSIHAPRLIPLKNARFLAVWRTGGNGAGVEWACERREMRWSEPRKLAADDPESRDFVRPLTPGGHVVLDNLAWARVEVEDAPKGDGVLVLLLSRDRGARWTRAGTVQTGAAEVSEPSIVATRVGLAILYVADGRRLMFWHGAVERITDGPPIASSARLNAPPEHIHSSQAIDA